MTPASLPAAVVQPPDAAVVQPPDAAVVQPPDATDARALMPHYIYALPRGLCALKSIEVWRLMTK